MLNVRCAYAFTGKHIGSSSWTFIARHHAYHDDKFKRALEPPFSRKSAHSLGVTRPTWWPFYPGGGPDGHPYRQQRLRRRRPCQRFPWLLRLRLRLPHPWPYCGCSVVVGFDLVAGLDPVAEFYSVAGFASTPVAPPHLQAAFALTLGTPSQSPEMPSQTT